MSQRAVSILLVDADQNDYEVVRALLSEATSQAFGLQRVSSLTGARTVLDGGTFDVCLLGKSLDEAGALALIMERKADTKAGTTPFICLTDGDETEYAKAASAAGALDTLPRAYLNAPLLKRSILYAVERAENESLLKNTRQEYDLLSTAVGHLSGGMLLMDARREGHPIIFANPALCAMTGYTVDEVMGRNPAFLSGPDTHPDTIKQLCSSIRGKTPFKGVLRSYRKDGSTFWCDLTLTPVFDEAGELTNFVGLQADVTAQFESEKALQDLQINLERAQQIARLGSWEIELNDLDDINSNPLLWSDEVFRLMGYAPGEIEVTSANFIRGVHPEDAERVGLAMVRALRGEEKYDIDHRVIWPDGSVHTIHAQADLIYDSTGKLIKMVGTGQDITERKATEDALRASEARFRTLVQSSWDAFHLVDREGKIVYESPSGNRVLGYEPEDMVGHEVTQFLHPDDVERCRESRAALVETPGATALLVLRAKHKDGSWRWIECSEVNLLEQPDVGAVAVNYRDITETKEAENALRRSEARFQNIVANVPGMVYQYACRKDGTVEWPFISDGSWAIFGVSPRTLQEEPELALDMMDPADRDKRRREAAISAAELSPWHWEGRVRTVKGTTRWVQIMSQPQRLPDGGTMWDGLVIDITDRKEAEEERDRFFNLSLDMLAIAGADGYFKRLNPACEAILGYTPSEMKNVAYMDLVHPDDHEKTYTAAENLTRGLPLINFENRFRCKDGSYRWLRWMSTPHENRWYCVGHDITQERQDAAALLQANEELEQRVERRTAELSETNDNLRSEIIERQRAQAQVQLGRQQLQSFLDAMSTLAARLSPDGNCLFVNHIAVSASGLSHEEYMRTNFLTGPWWNFDSEVQARVKAAFNKALTGRAVNYDEKMMAFGEIKTVNFGLTPILGPEGRVEHVIAEGRDITELKRTQDALQLAKAEAERANAAKSEFLSRLSHELRTPLNSILGFGQILDQEELAPHQRESVNYVLKGGHHLLDLINEVLDITRVETGSADLFIEPVALEEVIPEVCAMARPLARQNRIELDFNLESLENFHVLADSQRLKQVLINLVSNAVKYNRTDGTVAISAREHNGSIQIRVQDSGFGMPPSDLEKLFTPFERLSAASRQIEGTGLGLVISERLAKVMGGKLGVESVLGQGSTFWIDLPPAQPSFDSLLKAVNTSVLPPESELERSSTLLSIEDNPTNVRLLQAILSRRPEIELLTAMLGGIGLDMARKHRPDAILLDLNLPDLSGRDVLQQLQQHEETRDIPVVIISADAIPSQIQRLLDSGARHYLTKPLNVAEFLRVLDSILARDAVER